jgi:poly(beta-D-mannuronate) lyase
MGISRDIHLKIFSTFSVLILTFTQCAKAETYRITDPAKITSIGMLKPGDEIVITPGIYDSQKIMISGAGTSLLPVVIRGEMPGGVIFTGKTLFKLSGSFIVIKDLGFSGISPAGAQSLIEMHTTDSRIENCCISGNGSLPDTSADTKWVSLYGERNCVEYCTFEDKRNIGCLLVVWLEKGVVPNHKILNNYFSRPSALIDKDGGKINGQECIRIGTSDFSMQEGRCFVQGNTFYRCDAEIEVISNKSCYNVFKDNLFLECQGALTFRHGNNSLAEGNIFLGNSRNGTAGIRVIGDHHIIRNNYFESIRGTNYQAAICLIRGVKDSPLNRYYQVKECLVEGNTMLNCRNGVVVNYGSAPDQDLPVITTKVINNVIVNDNATDSAVVWIDNPGPNDVEFKENVIFGGRLENISEQIVPLAPQKPVLSSFKDKADKIRRESGAGFSLNK